MKEPLKVDALKFVASGIGTKSRVKVGELHRYQGGYNFLPDGEIDLKSVYQSNEVFADVYVDLSTLEWIAKEAGKHLPGVLGLFVQAVPRKGE